MKENEEAKVSKKETPEKAESEKNDSLPKEE